ncbi:MAG: hypothetical protein K2X27_10210 [Candidatus Obscuribacterales bacterium]|nr:hypothetical protein [Candidatus Obscuribacterales bacterium]
MSALLSEKSDRIQLQEQEVPAKAGFWLTLGAFLSAFIPCLLHNFCFCESRIMLATDGKHYLNTVALILDYFKTYAGTGAAAAFLEKSQLCGHLLLDGPLMSIFYVPLFLVLKQIPSPRDWQTLAIGQSFFHGASTLILSLLVFRVSGSRLTAFLAALAFGLYPPAVLQSGHFMSELPLTAVLLLMLLCLSNRRFFFLSFLTAGLSAGLIILSKPALIPGVGLLGIYALWRNRQWRTVLGLCLGLLFVLAPWFYFSFKATGSFSPTAQRQPLYNVATGWNTEADGWACNPHAPLTDMFSESDGPLPTAMAIWISRPQDSFALATAKLTRLFSFPWNDFKGRAVGLDENAQILIHRLFIACAFFGTAVYAFLARRSLTPPCRLPLELSFLLIVSHLSYLMVESQPRYAFSAMPFAILLAAYGIWQVSRLAFDDPRRRLVISAAVAFALACTALLMHAENISRLFQSQPSREQEHVLAKKDRLMKIIDLSRRAVPEPHRIKSVFLLLDGDKNLEKMAIDINDKHISVPLLSTMHFDKEHYALYDQFREFAPAMRVSVDDFRQWRALPLDAGLINWKGRNRIVLTTRSKTATIYGDRPKTRHLPSPDYCNYGILAAGALAAGAEPRVKEPVLACEQDEQSFLFKFGEPKARSLKDSLRIRLLVILAPQENQKELPALHSLPNPYLSPSVKSESLRLSISRKEFDQMLWDNKSNDCLQINKTVLYAAKTLGAEIALPDLADSTHLKLRLTGELKAVHHEGDVGILPALRGSNGSIQILGKTPRAIPAESNWRKFELDDLIPLSILGSKAEAFDLALYPCPWMEGQYGVSRRAADALFRNLQLELSPVDLSTIQGRRLIY